MCIILWQAGNGTGSITIVKQRPKQQNNPRTKIINLLNYSVAINLGGRNKLSATFVIVKDYNVMITGL